MAAFRGDKHGVSARSIAGQGLANEQLIMTEFSFRKGVGVRCVDQANPEVERRGVNGCGIAWDLSGLPSLDKRQVPKPISLTCIGPI